MKKLPTEISHRGYVMRQVKRSDFAAIYSKAGGFEVFKVKSHDGYEIKGIKMEPAEFMPSDEAFGTEGWYYIGPEARSLAEKKFRELNDLHEKKQDEPKKRLTKSAS